MTTMNAQTSALSSLQHCSRCAAAPLFTEVEEYSTGGPAGSGALGAG